MARERPYHAAVAVLIHAVSMGFAGAFEGLYVTAVTGWGAWLAFDPNADRVGAFLLAGYALFRFAAFLLALFTALLLVLAAYSLSVGHRRFVFVANGLGVALPALMLCLNLMTFNCCTVWWLPLLTAVPATAIGVAAAPRVVEAPIRPTW